MVMNSVLKGFATLEGTKRYTNNFSNFQQDFFKAISNLFISSIGFGTALGNNDEATDYYYSKSLEIAILSGCNIIDCALAYRSQRSEKIIGKTLLKLVDKHNK